MKVSELIAKLAKVDGELEVYAAPLVEIDVIGINQLGEFPKVPDTKLTPSPDCNFKVLQIVEGGPVLPGGFVKTYLLIGFDSSQNFETCSLENDSTSLSDDEFLN